MSDMHCPSGISLQIPDFIGCGLAESQKQYWAIKSQYRDTIIFFKVGKFYELYEVRDTAGFPCSTPMKVMILYGAHRMMF